MNDKSALLDSKIEDVNKIIKALFTTSNSVVCSTKFGPHSLVFLHLVSRISASVPVIWVDTGYNSRESIQFVQRAKSLIELNLHVFEPTDHVMRIPPGVDDEDHSAFSEEVKLAPFQKALGTLRATHWISSVRAYQTQHRQQLTATIKLSKQLTKVHPMLSWNEEDMNNYLERYELPKGPETFDPTKGDSFRECGLHL